MLNEEMHRDKVWGNAPSSRPPPSTGLSPNLQVFTEPGPFGFSWRLHYRGAID